MSVAAVAAGAGAWLAETLPARANVPRPAAARPLAARPPLQAAAAQLSPLDPPDADARADSPEAARALNRNVPVFKGPLEKARPFMLAADAEDRRRALDCLTSAIYYEAGFEPLEGERAVAQVVLNRLRHPLFPKSVCGVVYQGAGQPGCQFSFACDGSLRRAPMESFWRRAQAVAAAALNGFVYAPVGWSTHYHANYVMPYWAPTLVKSANVGLHIFYRWRGGWGRPDAFSNSYSGVEPAIAWRGGFGQPIGGVAQIAGSRDAMAAQAAAAAIANGSASEIGRAHV